MKFYVYSVTNNVNGRVYVGQTNNVKRRWDGHLFSARHKSRLPLHIDMRKFDEEDFRVDVLEECATREDAKRMEQEHILRLGSCEPARGYNTQLGSKPDGARARELHALIAQQRSDDRRTSLPVTAGMLAVMGGSRPREGREWVEEEAKAMCGQL